MPCFKILTNVASNKIPADFVDRIIPVLSRAVRKPPEKFICTITGDVQLCFGCDSKQPAAVATLESIGHLGPQENQDISKAVADYVEKEIGVPPNRMFISFYDVNGHFIGIAGSTAAHLGV